MYTCEAMERDKLKIANQYFSHLASKQTDAMDAILSCCKLEQHLLKNLIGMCQIKKIYIISIDVKLIIIFFIKWIFFSLSLLDFLRVDSFCFIIIEIDLEYHKSIVQPCILKQLI